MLSSKPIIWFFFNSSTWKCFQLIIYRGVVFHNTEDVPVKNKTNLFGGKTIISCHKFLNSFSQDMGVDFKLTECGVLASSNKFLHTFYN